MDRITGSISARAGVSGEISTQAGIGGTLVIPEEVLPERYEGAYTVTPSGQEQRLRTEGMMMRGDVIIEPIPQNYGLVTWDGIKITIS